MLQRIYLIRHGETDWNKEGRAQGQHDVPLNGKGREQARIIGDFLARLNPTAIICSDLSRARETAEIIGRSCGLTPEIRPGLRERDMGPFSGLTEKEIRRQGAADLTRWDGMPGVETDAEILARVMPCLKEFARERNGEGVVVTHGGVVKVVLFHVLGIEPFRPRRFVLHNGLVAVLRERDGDFMLEGFFYPDLLEKLSPTRG